MSAFNTEHIPVEEIDATGPGAGGIRLGPVPGGLRLRQGRVQGRGIQLQPGQEQEQVPVVPPVHRTGEGGGHGMAQTGMGGGQAHPSGRGREDRDLPPGLRGPGAGRALRPAGRGRNPPQGVPRMPGGGRPGGELPGEAPGADGKDRKGGLQGDKDRGLGPGTPGRWPTPRRRGGGASTGRTPGAGPPGTGSWRTRARS